MKNKEEIKVNCEICGRELKESQANCITKGNNYIICCDNCYNAIIDGYQPRLQALKVENYGLNQELLGYKKGVQAAEIIELKAENERLKAEIKNNKSAYQVELGTYNMECGNLLEENKQLLQTLQEIKEIAENTYEMCAICGNAKYFKKIIDIINKAEEE